MNQSAVLLVARQKEPSVLEVVAVATTEALGRCIPQPVPSAANRQKSRFNRAAISRFTAVIVTPPGPNKFEIIEYMGRSLPTHIPLFKGVFMALEVTPYDGETQESLVRRFQKAVQMEGILKEFRASQTFLCKRDAHIIKSKRAARRRRMSR